MEKEFRAISPLDLVEVVLTELGADIATQAANGSRRYTAEDKYECKLWELFRVFGPHMKTGNEPFFRGSIVCER